MSFLKITFFIVCLVGSTTFISAQVRLSEIVSKNNNSFQVNNQPSDWIEIYNAGENAINLLGYFLSDQKENSTKWAFPNCLIAPKSFLIILANGVDKKSAYLQTNFKLSSDGETFILSNLYLNSIGQIDLPPLATDISFAKIGDTWTTAEPSPQKPNEGLAIAQLSAPKFTIGNQ